MSNESKIPGSLSEDQAALWRELEQMRGRPISERERWLAEIAVRLMAAVRAGLFERGTLSGEEINTLVTVSDKLLAPAAR